MDADHAAVRSVHLLFDRALRRFKSDPAMWLQWIDFAMRSDGGKALSKIFPQALQLLPRSVDLWLQAAAWAFDGQGAVSEARMYLQRGLRVNASSQRLWLAYFRLECLYILRVRARRSLLGLDASEGSTEGAGITGAAAHKAAFMAGAVPQVVFNRAVEALPHDVSFKAAFLSCLRSIASAFDAAARDEADKAGQARPEGQSLLFPKVHAHIMGCIMKQHATQPAAWAVLADSVLAPARAAAAAAAAAPVEDAGAGDAEQQTQHAAQGLLDASDASLSVSASSAVDACLKRLKAAASLQDVLSAWAAAESAAAEKEQDEDAAQAVTQLVQQAESKAFAVMDRAVAACASAEAHAARCALVHAQLSMATSDAGRHAQLVARLLQYTTQASEAGCASGVTVLLQVAALQATGQHSQALAAARAATESGSAVPHAETWLTYASLLEQRHLVQQLHQTAHETSETSVLHAEEEGGVTSTPLAVLLAGCAAVQEGALLPVISAAVGRACSLYASAGGAPGSELHSAVAGFSAAPAGNAAAPGQERQYGEAVTGVPAACPATLASVSQVFQHVLHKCPREHRAAVQLQYVRWLAQGVGVDALLLLARVVTSGGASLDVHEAILGYVAVGAAAQQEASHAAVVAVFEAALREHGGEAPALWAKFVKWLRSSLRLSEASAAYDKALRSLGDNAPAFVEATAQE